MPSNLKERILQAASELFYRQGIRATGVDAIVKAAGTTKMSLYHYFPSKNDLVLAHLRKSGLEMDNRISSGVSRRAADPETRLLAVFDVFDELLALDEFRGCPFINAATEAAADDDPFKRASAEFYQKLHHRLAAMALEAQARRPELLARQLILLLAGAIIAEQMQRHSQAMPAARAAAEILVEQACMSTTGS